jgi:DNA-binding transcriptional LysR family regulator
MDYSNVETFLAIAETRSLSKAAEMLFLSQSTVSYRLKILEQEIGIPLIQREQGKGFITLTEKGEEFVNIAQRWVSLFQDTSAWKAQKSLYKLNIGCVDSLNTCLFHEMYKSLLKNDTPLAINVGTHWSVTIYKLIENYEIDVGFALSQLPSKNIVCKPLFSERMVLISSSDSKLPGTVHLKDLDPDKEIYLYCGPTFQAWHDNFFENTSRKFSSVDTITLLSSFINVPDFWSIVPISVAKKLVASNNITISEVADSPPERTCYQIINKNPVPNKLKILKIFDETIENFLRSDFFYSIVE